MASVLPNPSNFAFATIGILNGVTQWNNTRITGGSPGMVLGTRLRLGAGGDFCQPSQIIFREGLITNTQMTAGDEAALRANMVTFYSGLSFHLPAMSRSNRSRRQTPARYRRNSNHRQHHVALCSLGRASRSPPQA